MPGRNGLRAAGETSGFLCGFASLHVAGNGRGARFTGRRIHRKHTAMGDYETGEPCNRRQAFAGPGFLYPIVFQILPEK